MKTRIDLAAVHAQLCNELEAERAALRVYEAALPLAGPREHARWLAARDEARRSEQALCSIMAELGLDPDCESTQRRSVRNVGNALLNSLQLAPDASRRAALARECVRIVQQRERSNWLLLGQLLSGGLGNGPAANEASAAPRAESRSRRATLRPGWLEHAAHFRLRPRSTVVQRAG